MPSFDLIRFYQEGGELMHPILALGAVALVTGVLGTAIRERILGTIALLCAVLCLVLGGVGYQSGMTDLQAALSSAPPDMYEAARQRGTEIAMVTVYFGCAWFVPGFIFGLLTRIRTRA